MRGRNSERGQAHDGFVHLAPVLVRGTRQLRVCSTEESFQPKDLGLTGFL